MISPKLFNKELPSWLPLILAGVGAILYLIQAIIYAHTTVSSLDEGSYLIKGMFYLNGVYKPFEPYGPLTNKAPFAFLIPGIAEYLFGAGLRTGRYFSIFLGLLTILGRLDHCPALDQYLVGSIDCLDICAQPDDHQVACPRSFRSHHRLYPCLDLCACTR